jgi:hypothetical protein
MNQARCRRLAHHVGYCGANECQLSGELRKSLARARKVEDYPEQSLLVDFYCDVRQSLQ